MIPTGVATVWTFFFFVVPGLLAQFLKERRHPQVEESAFREISRVAFVSTPYSLVATTIVAFLTWLIHPEWFRLLTLWSVYGRPSSGAAVLAASVLTIVEASIASAAVWLTVRLRDGKKPQLLSESGQSAWLTTLKAPVDQVVIATVTTTDGVEYRGEVWRVTETMKWSEGEITLTQPLTMIKNGALSELDYGTITIPSSVVVAVAAINISKETADKIREKLRARATANK